MVLALLKNYLNYLKDNVFECFLRSIINFYSFLKNQSFLQHIRIESLSLEAENIVKDIRNLLE